MTNEFKMTNLEIADIIQESSAQCFKDSDKNDGTFGDSMAVTAVILGCLAKKFRDAKPTQSNENN